MSEKLKADHWRGLDFYQPQQDRNSHCVVVGAGSIGSYVAYGLARLGVKKITVIDFDTVENHNLPNQFFAESLELSEGIFKVNVLQKTIRLIVKDAEIIPIAERIENVDTGAYLPCTGFFICVDDMKVRKWIYQSQYIQKYSNCIIDARVGGLYANVFYYNSFDSKGKMFYGTTLHSNEEAAPLPCTGQAVVDVAMCVAGEMIARYRYDKKFGYYPAYHTFHDYNYGQAWIQEVNPRLTSNVKEIITSDEKISEIGAEPTEPESREETNG